jgi:hypothetical protein
MFQRLTNGMIENQRALTALLQGQCSLPKPQHPAEPRKQRPREARGHATDRFDEEVSDSLTSLLRRASDPFFSININESGEEEAGVDEGIFQIDDL